ncbi:hypothetical protein TNCV_3373551 [Trichonephila clavipes]|nr:hypothetical protein TNCV_3373551 [Trichonephila clavipes]
MRELVTEMDNSSWKKGRGGKRKKKVRERERTEGGGETEKRERRRKETERERAKPALNGEKGRSPEIGVKKTMNAGGVENGTTN